MKRLAAFGLVTFAALLMTTRDAHAYLDPGTGSMLLQGLIAGVAAASVALGGYWSKVKAFFSSDRKTRSRPADPPEQ
jgi:hypothetical protein